MDMSKMKRIKVEKKLKRRLEKRRKDVNTERQQINAIVREALKDENRDNEKLFQILWEVGKGSWKSLCTNFVKRFAGHILEDDLEMAAKEGLYFAITRLKPTSNPFGYLRLCVKGFIMDWIMQNAFPLVMWDKKHRIENMRVIRINHEGSIDDDDENIGDADDIIAALTYHETGFEEVELRDLIEKMLSHQEKTIAYLLLDGYGSIEISDYLGKPVCEVRKMIGKIRRKLRKEFNCLGGDGNGRISH